MAHGTVPHVVIVGGGIAGLAAAFFLRDEPVQVTVLEGAKTVGGKLASSEVAGVEVDSGAEALLARRPEGTDLITATGLGERLVPAGVVSSAIYSRGALHPLPKRQFMGVPADIAELAATGIVSDEGIRRAEAETAVPLGDVSVREYVGGRLGPEVVDRLVDPLLGGVYAGRSEDLSFRATLAPLAAAAANHDTLTGAVASLLPPVPASGPTPAPAPGPAAVGTGTPASAGTLAPQPADNSKKPVFVSLTTGLGALPEAVARASRAEIRVAAMVRELTRTGDGWRLTVGSAAHPEHMDADAVILAVPAVPASRLLSRTDRAASAALDRLPYASMAIITLAFRASDFPGDQLGRSGYLVPAVDGRAVKAATFSTVKWPHLARRAGDLHIVRCSIGRAGEVALLQRDDEDLVSLAAKELGDAAGITAAPVAGRVTRWGGALPQYNVGHLDRVAAIRDAVAAHPGLAVAGAAYDGVGIPACISTAHTAAAQILTHLRTRPGAAARGMNGPQLRLLP